MGVNFSSQFFSLEHVRRKLWPIHKALVNKAFRGKTYSVKLYGFLCADSALGICLAQYRALKLVFLRPLFTLYINQINSTACYSRHV